MPEPPLVSVIVAAYNHDDLVGRAIESALAQITSFNFEIVVGEDCSTDRTREVVAGYARRYPEQVKLICNAQNMYIPRNMDSMMRASCGRYIAWLDADDYWTDPYKLEKQITFLEQHPEYVASSHNVRVVLLSGEVNDPSYPGLPTESKTLESVIQENFVPSPSIVFRNTLTGRIPDWYFSNPHADWPLWMILAQDGPFMHFEETMADYTMHPQSVWSSRGPVYRAQMEIDLYRRCPSFLPTGHERLIRSCEGVRYERQSRAYISEGNWPAARKAAIMALTVPDWRDNLKDKTRLLLDACAPSFMETFRSLKGIKQPKKAAPGQPLPRTN